MITNDGMIHETEHQRMVAKVMKVVRLNFIFFYLIPVNIIKFIFLLII